MVAPAPLAEGARPRVEGEREQEILQATVEILCEHGYDRLTMDAVATRSKASKATLYRRWRSKPSLVVDAVRRSKGEPLVDHDTGSLRGDLLTAFCGPTGAAGGEESTGLMAAVVTALHTDPEFAAEFRSEFVMPRVELNQQMFRRAQERGEIPDSVDISLVGPVLPAVLLHRAFIFGEQITEELILRVVDEVVLPAATRGG